MLLNNKRKLIYKLNSCITDTSTKVDVYLVFLPYIDYDPFSFDYKV